MLDLNVGDDIMNDLKVRQPREFAKALALVHHDKPAELKAFLLNNFHLKTAYQVSAVTESREYHGGDEVDTTEVKTEKNLMWFAIQKNKPECLKVLIDFYGTLENCEKTVTTATHTTYFFGGRSSEHESKNHKNAVKVAEACEASLSVKQVLFDSFPQSMATSEKEKTKVNFLKW